MTEKKKEISKWVGWLLTVVISLVAAVAASSARVATLEEKACINAKNIERLENSQTAQFSEINRKLDLLLIQGTQNETEIKNIKKWE